MGFAFDESGMPLLAPPEPSNGTPQPSNGTQYTATLQLPLGVESSIKDPVREATAPQPDVKIGEVLAQAQRFADESADRAQRQAQEIVGAARAEASLILERARQEASTASSASPSAIAPEAIATLCAAIEEFATSNRSLVTELAQLSQALVDMSPDARVPAHRVKSSPPVEAHWLPLAGTPDA